MRGKSPRPKTGKQITPANALTGVRSTIIFLFILSGVLSALALTGALYMLQIYDRALTSQSVPTLLALSGLAIGLYLCHGVLDITRSQILVRLGAQVDAKLAPLAHKVTIDMPRFGYSTSEAMDRGRDVDTLRQFLSGQGPHAIFDLPWTPLYIVFVYLLHPYLGMLAILGATVLASLTLATELLTRMRSQATHRSEVQRADIANGNVRNSEVICAMGFSDLMISRFTKANNEHLTLQTKTNDVTGSFSGLSKVLRMILQSAVLGLGAYLAIRGELTPGAIIAASVAAARALAPIDLAIGQWKGFVAARRSYGRLSETLSSIEDNDANTVALPAPARDLKVDRLTVAAPGSGRVILSDVSFGLTAGQALGIIGPSGGGKSSLARALTRAWPVVRGSVRLDDAELSQWTPSALGQHIGYIPQDVSLMDGTVAENISRFQEVPDGAQILAAARAADVHKMIVNLPQGYQTELGPHGTALSAGQRQRIALARALYGEPFLVILDEPNSNLDFEGEQALTAAIEAVKARNGIVMVIAHRPSAIAACDLLGVMKDGRLTLIGPKDEVIANLSSLGAAAQTAEQSPRATTAKAMSVA